MLGMLLGQQGGFTKYPYFLFQRNNKAHKGYTQQNLWLEKEKFIVGEKYYKKSIG